MRVVLNHGYKGPFVGETGAWKRYFDLSAGEHDLTAEEIEFLRKHCPKIIGPPDRDDHSVIGPPDVEEKEISEHHDKKLRGRFTK